jgi:hypothetical protein
VEDLTTEDFVRSADFSPDVGIDHSEVIHLKHSPEDGSCGIGFSVGKQRVQASFLLTLFYRDRGTEGHSLPRGELVP